MSAIERCPLFLSAIKRFFYETLTMISSVLRKTVRYRKVSAIKHVRYREVPLYAYTVMLRISARALINGRRIYGGCTPPLHSFLISDFVI